MKRCRDFNSAALLRRDISNKTSEAAECEKCKDACRYAFPRPWAESRETRSLASAQRFTTCDAPERVQDPLQAQGVDPWNPEDPRDPERWYMKLLEGKRPKWYKQ